MKRRVIALIITILIVISSLPVQVYAATSLPGDIYLKQETNYTCTLSSAAMMLRSRMYLSNNENWRNITESSIKSSAWVTEGLRWNWSYNIDGNSMTVSHASVSGMSVSSLKTLLNNHPEGVVLYIGSIPHAVFLIDYEGDTFYCADPAAGYSGRRMTLASSWLGNQVGNQSTILNAINAYWYISSYSINPSLTSFTINYNANGGTCETASQTVSEGQAIGTMPAAVRSGYIFDGWYTSASGGTRVYEDSIISSSMTLYAHWRNDIVDLGTEFFAFMGHVASGHGIVNAGSNVELGEAHSRESQWFFTRQSDGSYEIVSAVDSRALDVYNADVANCTNVQVYDSNNTLAQRWYIRDAGNGYVLHSACSGKALDVEYGGTGSLIGDNLQIYTANDNPAQIMYIDVPYIRTDGVEFPMLINETYYISFYKEGSYHGNWRITLESSDGTVGFSYDTVVDNCQSVYVTPGTAGTHKIAAVLWDEDTGIVSDYVEYELTVHSEYTVTMDDTYGNYQYLASSAGVDSVIPYYFPNHFGKTFLGWGSKGQDTVLWKPGDAICPSSPNFTIYAKYQDPVTLPATSSYYERFVQPYYAISADGTPFYWLTYTPTISTSYEFKSYAWDASWNVDDMIYIFNSNGELVVWDDDSGDDLMFRTACEMTAGETYYIGIATYHTPVEQTWLFVDRGYKITYDANGGTNAPAYSYIYSGDGGTLSAEIPSRTGYTFVGWAKEANATAADYSAGKHIYIYEDTTLYAVWEEDVCSHSFSGWTQVEAPTCTTEGSERRDCTKCDYYETRTVDVLGHDWQDATCTTGETCLRCGETKGTALGHTWNNGVVTREPTETAEGELTYTCTVCGVTRTESIPVLPHEHSYESVVTAPTCTERGYTTYTCECGDSYTADYVSALGHDWQDATCTTPKTCLRCGVTNGTVLDHTWNDGVVTREPTETAEGEKTYTCTACGATRTESIPPLTHEHSYETAVTPPTCTEQGYTTYTCECGDTYTADYVTALGHAWDEGIVVREPTETQMGEKTYTCTVCGVTRMESIPPTDHEHSYEATVTPPTCTERGYTTYTCECGDSYIADYVSALGHDWLEATCTEPETCSRCAETRGEANGHDFVDGECADCGAEDPDWEEPSGPSDPSEPSEHEHSYETEVTPPTCTERGYTTYTCECGDTYRADYVNALGHDWLEATCTEPETCSRCGLTRGDPKGHNYVEGECTDCGEEDPDYEPVPSEPAEPQEPEYEGILRLSGTNRYLTGFAVADQLKKNLGVEKFETVVVAYGENFPDALSGSYLAYVNNAPILLTKPSVEQDVVDYILQNTVPGGTVYLLGDEGVVPASIAGALSWLEFRIVRLAGPTRYETNMEILREAGISPDQPILIATGTNYADSLSASATGLPMLLVGKQLSASQKEFLQNTSGNFVILGGYTAVSTQVENELKALGTVARINGKDRFLTSVLIGQKYFPDADTAVLAYAQGFPDGLCGGPLALSMGAPLILTTDSNSAAADNYLKDITSGAVTGGTSRISDDTVREIFDLPDDTPIVKP